MTVLGIDQGHSKTLAVVCRDDGTLLGLGRARGACHALHGLPVAMQAIAEAAHAALAQAACRPQDIGWLVAGLTGADWPDEYNLLAEAVTALGLSQQVIVKNDSLVALRGGTAAPYGAVLIAGSGANCAVLAPSGAEWLYGYYVEPELQGGSALGRMALREVYRAASLRQAPTMLTGALLQACGLESVDALLRADGEHRLPLAERELAPQVFDCAEAGDPVAEQLLGRLGAGLAELVTAGLREMQMTTMPVEVVLAGGLFRRRGSLLIETLRANIQAAAPLAQLVEARYEPVVGAALLALEAAGLSIDTGRAERIEASAQALGLRRETAEENP